MAPASQRGPLWGELVPGGKGTQLGVKGLLGFFRRRKPKFGGVWGVGPIDFRHGEGGRELVGSGVEGPGHCARRL